VDCKAFDEQVVRRDSRVRDLMDQFVCVRLVQGNAMDLTLFQFDYDLTFAAFFMNADRTIYGRFGSRSDRKEATKDISMEGFREALAAALELHSGYPANKASLMGKQSRTPRFKTPDEYPSLKGKYQPKLDYEGKVVQSCMHCHQIGEAERVFFRADRKPIPDEVLYPWPMPAVIGLTFDSMQKAKIKSVSKASIAEKAGFKAGDVIVALDGQPILSIADVQWVLHHATQPAVLKADLLRGKKKETLTLSLSNDWRRHADISWRTTTWDLRRMASGGLVLKDATADERRKAKLSDSTLGLRVEYVGQYGDHAAGQKAGFKKDDLLISVDGQTGHMTESDLFGYLLQNRMAGTQVPVTVLRAGSKVDLVLPMQ
jgi:serine protease Do